MVIQTQLYPPFPCAPVTSSAASVFYSPLCKPAPCGSRPSHGDGLGLWHTSFWRNKGWTRSFNLPFLHLQSGTSTSLWHNATMIHFWMLKASIGNVKGSRERFSEKCKRANRMWSSQQHCSAFHPGDLRRSLMKHWGSGDRNHYKHRQVLPQSQQVCVLVCWHTETVSNYW